MSAPALSHAFEGGRCERLRASSSLTVRITQLDGKLPNLALMKLAAFHRDRGDSVHFTRNARRDLFEPDYDIVYGSAIFTRSLPLVKRLCSDFPGAIVGGTGLADSPQYDWKRTVEQYLSVPSYEQYDYSIYDRSGFTASIGFSQRGCRLACKFCRVPQKEGRPSIVGRVADIWRGDPYPRHIMLLDNDFFGVPQSIWEANIDEIISGRFKVSLIQGINVRLIDATIAKAIARMPYYDDDFQTRRLYTAWDNLKDEQRFLTGVHHLLNAGVKPGHLMVYMLTGFDPQETWERLFHRFETMRDLGLKPYPMVFERAPGVSGNTLPYKELKAFQRWVLRGYYRFIPWSDYDVNARSRLDDHHTALELGLTA